MAALGLSEDALVAGAYVDLLAAANQNGRPLEKALGTETSGQFG